MNNKALELSGMFKEMEPYRLQQEWSRMRGCWERLKRLYAYVRREEGLSLPLARQRGYELLCEELCEDVRDHNGLAEWMGNHRDSELEKKFEQSQASDAWVQLKGRVKGDVIIDPLEELRWVQRRLLTEKRALLKEEDAPISVEAVVQLQWAQKSEANKRDFMLKFWPMVLSAAKEKAVKELGHKHRKLEARERGKVKAKIQEERLEEKVAREKPAEDNSLVLEELRRLGRE